ncbi:MAG TPA: hypothetical protein VK841_19535 [Polyangiaceae bacterium]|jgi:hypothetical protein|nr:hypothetical protein [Polyangiaceae bacterium]
MSARKRAIKREAWRVREALERLVTGRGDQCRDQDGAVVPSTNAYLSSGSELTFDFSGGRQGGAS